MFVNFAFTYKVHGPCRVYKLWHRWQHFCQTSNVASAEPELMVLGILGHMAHLHVAWPSTCPLWYYYCAHLHTSCLREIVLYAVDGTTVQVSSCFRAMASLRRATWSKPAFSSQASSCSISVILVLLLLLLLFYVAVLPIYPIMFQGTDRKSSPILFRVLSDQSPLS